MPSSERDADEILKTAKVIANVLKILPSEIDGRLVAVLIVNILYLYDMNDEWPKILDVVDETLDDMDNAPMVNVSEVLMN
jgi:hypothetical protein